jgi:hypothetical protein
MNRWRFCKRGATAWAHAGVERVRVDQFQAIGGCQIR